MDLDKLDYKKMLLVITFVYLIIRVPIIDYVPFVQDEAFYSVMIEEQIENPTLIVTLFDYPVGWKPPLFFWISGFFVQFLRDLPIPIEAVYRLPNLLFGLMNAILVFFIFEKFTKRKDEAFLMALAYVTLGLNIHTELRVLTDTLCGTFIFAGVLAYINGLKDEKLFVLGGIFTFLAYFVKQTNAATVPIVAVAYLFQNDKKKIMAPIFLLSLLAFPMAMMAEGTITTSEPVSMTNYVAKNLIIEKLTIENIIGSIIGIFPLTVAWCILAMFGFVKSWKENLAITVWFILGIFPLIASTLMPFYFYPIIPPLVYLGVKYLSMENGKIKLDKFFYYVFSVVIILSFVVGFFAHLSYEEKFSPQKNAGEFLVGKENVLIIGTYMPDVAAYKMLEEKRETGSWLDYGLITMLRNTSEEEYYIFIQNYSENHSYVIDSNFAGAFTIPAIYRKDTNITKFDYIAILGDTEIYIDGNVVFEDKRVIVYHLQNESG
ncbi:MAG: hypothetical protein ABH842_01195 [Candidatus Micrarchaeota archaeon]